MRVELKSTSTDAMQVIGLDEVKDHLRIPRGEPSEDDYLETLREVAIDTVQSYTGRKLLTQTWYYYQDEWPSTDNIEMPFAPLQSVPATGIYYTNSTNDSTTFSSTEWAADTASEPGRIILEYDSEWPTSAVLDTNNPIRYEFVCGYTTPSNIPAPIKHATKMIISELYENREESLIGQSVTPMPWVAKRLLAPYRMSWTA